MKNFLLIFLFLTASMFMYAQERTVTGKIISKTDGQTIPGASVKIKGTTKGTLTDLDGNFKIKVPSDSVKLVFSFVGYETQEIAVKNKVNIQVTLKENIKSLDQVVVIGYGSQKKSDLTGSISTVTADDIEKVPVSSVEEALRGKAAGVTVTQNSGTPGGGAMVRIRGVGTINGADPLFVVDGIAVDNIDAINPGDIATMEILKDASACAIYGSRGANGVVLITTKKGKEGKPVITYEVYSGYQQAAHLLKLTDAQQWATLRNDADINAGYPLDFTSQQIATMGKGTDWQKQVFQTAPMTRHQISITGGTNISQYSVSSSYFNQEGIVKGSNYERLTFHVGDDMQLNKKLKVGVSLNIEDGQSNNVPEKDESGGVLYNAILMDPVTHVTDKNGNYIDSKYNEALNPVAIIARNHNTDKNFTMIGSAYLNYEILEGLKFRSQLGVEESDDQTYQFTPQYYISDFDHLDTNQVSRFEQKTENWTWENTMTYNKKIGKHDITLLAGETAESHNYPSLGGSVEAVPNTDPNLWYLSTSTYHPQVQSGMVQTRLFSLLGRLIYNFKDKYLLTASLRRDGSSIFGEGRRYGNFPSFSLGWKIREENFLKDIKWLSNAKIRGGWGQIGNQDIPQNGVQTTVDIANYNYLFGNPHQLNTGAAVINFPDNRLQWEASEQTNIGVDLGVLKNKLELTADYFIKNTNHILVAEPVSATSGYGGVYPFENGASVRNKGIETQLTYRGKIGEDFEFEFTPNVSYVKNVVTSLGQGGSAIFADNFRGNGGYISYTNVGYPIASFYGYKTDGIFQNQAEINNYKGPNGQLIQPFAKPGDVKYVDINHDGVIDANDETVIGSPWPKFTFGGDISLSYKNFELDVFIQGVSGNQIFNTSKFYNESSTAETNLSASMVNAWTPENHNNQYAQMTVNDLNQNTQLSDRYIEDGSYWRIKNIQLSYNIPEKIMQKIKLASAKLYIRSANLYTHTKYTGYDPEIGMSANPTYGEPNENIVIGVDRANYPQARSLLLGIILNF